MAVIDRLDWRSNQSINQFRDSSNRMTRGDVMWNENESELGNLGRRISPFVVLFDFESAYVSP